MARGLRWRGGAEQRVVLGHTTSVLPWPSVPVDDGAPRLAIAALVRTYEGWQQREPMVLEHRPMEPAAAMVRGDDVKPVGGFEGFDLDYNPAPSSRSVPDSPLDALTSGAPATSRTLAPSLCSLWSYRSRLRRWCMMTR
jgi:hypothetical protein